MLTNVPKAKPYKHNYYMQNVMLGLSMLLKSNQAWRFQWINKPGRGY